MRAKYKLNNPGKNNVGKSSQRNSIYTVLTMILIKHYRESVLRGCESRQIVAKRIQSKLKFRVLVLKNAIFRIC